jgi:hypothetical protein
MGSRDASTNGNARLLFLANRKVLLALQFLDDVADLEGGAQLEAQIFHHHVGGEKEQGLSCTTEITA